MSETKKYILWLRQAENDLKWAQYSLEGGYFAQVCFICQQIGEKAVKSLAYYRGADFVKGHSIVMLAKELKINGEIEKAGQILDLYYISSRYPDGLPSQVSPIDYFSKSQADDAILLAQTILKKVQSEIV
jgi:HEPN domain-containing protein